MEENRESRERQYALADLAQQFGWPVDRVLVIDEDQGLSGKSSERAWVVRPLEMNEASHPTVSCVILKCGPKGESGQNSFRDNLFRRPSILGSRGQTGPPRLGYRTGNHDCAPASIVNSSALGKLRKAEWADHSSSGSS